MFGDNYSQCVVVIHALDSWIDSEDRHLRSPDTRAEVDCYSECVVGALITARGTLAAVVVVLVPCRVHCPLQSSGEFHQQLLVVNSVSPDQSSLMSAVTQPRLRRR